MASDSDNSFSITVPATTISGAISGSTFTPWPPSTYGNSSPYVGGTLPYTHVAPDQLYVAIPGTDGFVTITDTGLIMLPEGVEASDFTKELCTQILSARKSILAKAVETALLSALSDMAEDLFPDDPYKKACWPAAMAATIRKKAAET